MSSTSNAPLSPTTPGLLLTRLSDDFLRCPSCQVRYSQPRLLVCLHAVCHSCLDALAARAAPSRPSRYRSVQISVECPVCQRLTDVTPGVDRLPIDSVRSRLLELVSVAQERAAAAAAVAASSGSLSDGGVASADLCELCSRNRQASSRCLDCGKLLCIACRQRHRRVRVTSEHELVDVDRQMALRCERHSDELVRFYCISCQAAVCIGCTFSSEHAEHTVLKFKDAAQQKAEELAEFSRQSVEKLCQLRAALQLARNIEAHLTDTETAIRDAASQQVAAIKTAQQTLLEELRTFYDCCSELLSGRHELAAALRDLTEVSSFSELVERGRYSESLMLAPRVAATLARYAQYQPPAPPPTPRRYRLLFLDAASIESSAVRPAVTLGRLEMQRLTSSSCCFSDSSSAASSCVDVTSLSSSDSGSSCDLTADAGDEASAAESFFIYDNSTLRSSVCRSLTTDTLVASTVDVECQTDFHLVVQLGFARASRYEVLPNACETPDVPEVTEELAAPNLTTCQQCFEQSEQLYSSGYCEPEYQFIESCPMVQFVRYGAAISLQTLFDSVENLQLEPTKRQSSEDEVRVCSVMFSSMESDDCDNLETQPPPKMLNSVGCQHDQASALVKPLATMVATTQTPHLPRRRDLADSCSQTVQLASFSRDIQVETDSEERATQTSRMRRFKDECQVDRATQWEPTGRAYQEFYRSGRLVRVVGGGGVAGGGCSSSNSSGGGGGSSGDVCNSLALSPRAARRYEATMVPTASAAGAPQLHQLTQRMKLKRHPEALPPLPPRTTSPSASAAAGPSTSAPRAAPSGVKFAKPPSQPASSKPEEAMSSLDRLKNFCSRLRQRRTGLGKQKIVLLTDQ